MIDDTARSADDDLDTLLQLKELAVVGGSAIDGHGVDGALESGELVHLVGYLLGKLAGRAEDQDLDGLACRIDLLNGGNGEGRGLAGACLGLTDKITASQEDGNGCGLNRSGFFETELGDCLDNFGGETQAVEALFFHKQKRLRPKAPLVTFVRRNETYSRAERRGLQESEKKTTAVKC